ncbi:MAG TPA: carboxymuconolactone decarboxylase family protein [Burkholderiales bacterium]|nr:carboxymuconolactone decarboxylase family protein [Burkholderiales bacterium]
MTPRLPLVPVEEARRLGAEMGLGEAQASRSAFRMLAHHPDLVRQVYGLLRMLQTRNKLPSRLRELMIMRIGWTTDAAYEWFQHYRIATQEVGLTDEEIVAVRDWKKSGLFSAADRAVLAAVDDTRERGEISEAVWADCERLFPEPALLVEMAVMIGNWTLFSQIIKTLRIPVEGGDAWPPDGQAPRV